MLDDHSISILPGEEKRAEDALAALAKDPHAPNEISLRFRLHVHHEYPKMLYKDRAHKHTLKVANEAEEKAAIEQGYSTEAPAHQAEVEAD